MDFDALTAPLEGPSPCGEDLSFSPAFDQIADMRREDDPTLNQGEWITALKAADWPGVSRLCQQLLNERSKDLRLVMWLTEAEAMQRGYAGLRDGLTLCAALCRTHWPALYPQPDGDDMDERVGNLGWLLQKVQHFARTRPITRGRQGAAYSLRDLAVARQQSGQPAGADAGQAPAADALTVEGFMRALRETPREQLRDEVLALQQCHEALQALQAVIDAELGAEGPSFVSARDALQDARHDLERLAREVGALDAPASEPPSATAESPPHATGPERDAPGAPTALHGPVASRTQALQQLREVATFVRRTEPHSPVAYLADKAVKWAEMPLHEWLRHVVKDQGAMSHLEELLGLQADATDSNSH